MEFKEPLPEEEQKILFEKLKEHNEPDIKDKLILHNLRLVHWVAKWYYKPDKNELDDLFQVGVIGLMRAIEDYDPNKGAFSTYAVMWIKQSIVRDIAITERVIRIPGHMIQKVNNLIGAKNKLIQLLGREPTPRELSIEMELDIDSINGILTIVQDPISLHTVMGGDDGDLTLEDSIPDDGPPTDLLVEGKIFLEKFRDVAKEKLTELQYNTIILSVGLEGREYTLKEIAAKYKYSSESIRSERDKGLRILQRTRYFQEIRAEVDERTSYARSIDYTQPKVTGGMRSSPVEELVMLREKMFKRIKREKEATYDGDNEYY